MGVCTPSYRLHSWYHWPGHCLIYWWVVKEVNCMVLIGCVDTVKTITTLYREHYKELYTFI